MADKTPTTPDTADTAQEQTPAEIVEPTADGITTTLDDEGNIIPLERHERSYDHSTGAFD